jgi:hypothetical protein
MTGLVTRASVRIVSVTAIMLAASLLAKHEVHA